MDDFTAEILNAVGEHSLNDVEEIPADLQSEAGAEKTPRSKGFRSRFLDAAGIQDKLLEK